MHIALVAHDNKKELMESFCIAYKFILKKHEIYSTGSVGTMIKEIIDIPLTLFDSGKLGEEQIAARVAYNEMDLVIFFRDWDTQIPYEEGIRSLRNLCDQNNIPFATNIATAEILILGLERGDFAWREHVNPKYIQQ